MVARRTTEELIRLGPAPVFPASPAEGRQGEHDVIVSKPHQALQADGGRGVGVIAPYPATGVAAHHRRAAVPAGFGHHVYVVAVETDSHRSPPGYVTGLHRLSAAGVD